MQFVEHLAALEVAHDTMFGAISAARMDFIALDLAIFAPPAPRARLFVRPSRRHKESPGFAGEVAECVQRRF